MAGRHRTPFGGRLKQAREAAGLEQQDAAQKAGIAQGTLSGLEREASASRHTATLAQLYGVNPVWLATGVGAPHDPIPLFIETLDDGSIRYGSGFAKAKLPVKEWVRAIEGGELLPQERLDPGYVEVYAGKDEYALRVRGDGLSPMADDGQVLIVSSALRPIPNGRALVTLLDGTRYCRRFLAETEDTVLTQDIVSGHPHTLASVDVERLERVVNVCDQGSWYPSSVQDAPKALGLLEDARKGARRSHK